VVPVAGPSNTADTVITPGPDSDESLPRLARGLTEDWGYRYRLHATDADVVVAVRSYLGLFALGMARATNAPVIVDLDDDDADYFRQRGDLAESQRFESLVSRLRERGALLVSASGFDDTHRVPNTAPQPASTVRTSTVPGRVVLVGNCRYEPNAEGAQWFIDEVLPLIREQAPAIDVRLIGPASEHVTPYGIGIVDDLADEYAHASIAVCPILTGSGTRTKIIEAWMYGVPVVSTSIGADGLGATDGEHLLIADSARAFADQVRRLLGDQDLSDAVADAARHLAEQQYSPDIAASAVAAAVLPLVTDRTRSFSVVPHLHLTETEDGLVVLDRSNDSVHNLNSTAAMVLLLADGHHAPHDIADEIGRASGLDDAPIEHVTTALTQLCHAGLIASRFDDRH
jgi:glycosyltransferase involved in cell wall biosynthesis